MPCRRPLTSVDAELGLVPPRQLLHAANLEARRNANNYSSFSASFSTAAAAAAVLFVVSFHLINPVVSLPLASSDLRFYFRRHFNGSGPENMALSRDNDDTSLSTARDRVSF
jgi:hypothetical protein